MFYSATTGGFYLERIHGGNVPGDAVPVSESEHRRLLAGQASGQVIVADPVGFPILEDAPVPAPQAQLDAAREAASVTKRVLARGLLDHEVLSGPDAILVARGEWPTVLQPYLDAMPEVERWALEIDWAGSNEIERMHSSILLFQNLPELAVSDPVADLIFGIDPDLIAAVYG